MRSLAFREILIMMDCKSAGTGRREHKTREGFFGDSRILIVFIENTHEFIRAKVRRKSQVLWTFHNLFCMATIRPGTLVTLCYCLV
jgi:hypothetical protein